MKTETKFEIIKKEHLIFENLDEYTDYVKKQYYPNIIETKEYKHNIKLSYLEKWIKQNQHLEVFTLEQFYKSYPKQKENSRLTNNISKLIKENKILQLGKNKFKVVR